MSANIAETKHIPAWKRLGLKLKRAPNTSDETDRDPPQSQRVDPVVSKVVENGTAGSNKRSRELTDELGTSKRAKVSDATDHNISDVVDDELSQTATSRFVDSFYKSRSKSEVSKTPQRIKFDDDEPNPPLQTQEGTQAEGSGPAKTRHSRKKSVTFTPETKNEDGISAQSFSKTWLAPQRQVQGQPTIESESIVDTPSKAAKLPVDAEDIPSPAVNGSKPQKAKKDKTRQLNPGADSPSAYVKYLDQFHHDKPNWKFNKSKQNDLLKNVWNVYRIPPSFNEALISYMDGLQGAGARRRLMEGAEEVLQSLVGKYGEAESAAMNTPEGRKVAYAKTLKTLSERCQSAGSQLSESDAQHMEEMRVEAERGKRAGLLLREVLWKGSSSDQSLHVAKPANPANGHHAIPADATDTTRSKRRSRKARTSDALSSETSSSSSSDSDSSSSSSSSADSDSDSESD